jgi:hypothetical protein
MSVLAAQFDDVYLISEDFVRHYYLFDGDGNNLQGLAALPVEFNLAEINAPKVPIFQTDENDSPPVLLDNDVDGNSYIRVEISSTRWASDIGYTNSMLRYNIKLGIQADNRTILHGVIVLKDDILT